MSDTVATRGRKPFAETHFNLFMSKNKNAYKVGPNDAFESYSTWAEQNGYKTMCKTSFVKLHKSTVTIEPNTISAIERTNNMSLVEQFDTLEQYISIMVRGVINSLFVYGMPGIGKTETVIRGLQKANANFKHIQGGIKDAYSLAHILYENRDGKILVLDDFDSVFKLKGATDILKTALQDHTKRTITWADGTKRPRKDSVPREFEFTSSVIFISNRQRLDPALKDRSMIVRIEASRVEALEWVHLHFDTFLPKIPMEIKNTVYEFLKANVGKFNSMSYRVFKKAVCDYLICDGRGLAPNYWKKVVLQNANF